MVSAKYRGTTAPERDAAQMAIDAIDAVQWCADRGYIVRRLAWLSESILGDCKRADRPPSPAEARDLQEAIEDANDFIEEID